MSSKPKRVEMELGATINMGNYQSLKVSIRAEMNVLPGETIDDVLDDLQGYLVDQLYVRVGEVKEELREIY